MPPEVLRNGAHSENRNAHSHGAHSLDSSCFLNARDQHYNKIHSDTPIYIHNMMNDMSDTLWYKKYRKLRYNVQETKAAPHWTGAWGTAG